MGWFGPQSGSCGCCSSANCCEQYVDEMQAAGIGGITGSVAGTYFNLSFTQSGSLTGTCGWTGANRLCLASGSDTLLPISPSGSVYWAEQTFDSFNCSNPTPASYGYISGGVSSGCDNDGGPLFGASLGFRYRIAVYFVFPGYNATAAVVAAGYTAVSTNNYRREDGDPTIGLYKAATAVKSTSGGVEVWDITGFMSYISASPSAVAGYSFASWSPWYNPVGSSLSGTVL